MQKLRSFQSSLRIFSRASPALLTAERDHFFRPSGTNQDVEPLTTAVYTSQVLTVVPSPVVAASTFLTSVAVIMSSFTELGGYLRKIKAECSEAYARAKREGDLSRFIVDELKRRKISFDAALLARYIDKSLVEEEDVMIPPATSELINDISRQLDMYIFHPLLKEKANPMEATILSKVSLTQYYRSMHPNLRITKVMCAFFGICALGTAIVKGLRGNGGLLVVYGAIAADLFRVSYNACTEHYILLVIRKMSSAENITKSIFDWASNALGISSKDSDIFAKLNAEVRSEILLTDTITQKAVQVLYDVHRR